MEKRKTEVQNLYIYNQSLSPPNIMFYEKLSYNHLSYTFWPIDYA